MNEIYGGLASNPVNKIDVTIPNNRTITFEGSVVETPVEIPEKIVLATISLQTDPASTGTVTGGGVYQVGTQATVVATPDAQSDYPEFDGWYEGETKVSENASYTFTVSGARTLVAKFKEATVTQPSLVLKKIKNDVVYYAIDKDEKLLVARYNALQVSVEENIQYASLVPIGDLLETYINTHGYVNADSYTSNSVTYLGFKYTFSPQLSPTMELLP